MPAGQPSAQFDLNGEDLTGRGVSIARAHLAGRLRWPDLNLDVGELAFVDGSTLEGAGKMDLKSRRVSAGTWRFQGGWARRFRPNSVAYANVQGSGKIAGSPGGWVHSCALSAEGFSAPHLKPCRLLASWRGDPLAISEANVKMASGTSALELAG